jgi:hypothetical protein
MTLAALLSASPFQAAPADVLLGRLVLAAYDQGFSPTPISVDLAPLGFTFEDTWVSHGAFEPAVCYGIVARHPDLGRHLAIRGTEDGPEWAEDAEFWPETCPFAPNGAKTEAGFTSLVLGGSLASGRPVESLMPGGELALDGVEGHSLGGAIAEGVAALVGAGYAGLWAAPRLGNAIFRDWLLTRVKRVFRPYLVGDGVPSVPLDLPPFFEYLHPPGFQIGNGRVLNNPKARHSLLSYLNAFDPTIAPAPSCAVGSG